IKHAREFELTFRRTYDALFKKRFGGATSPRPSLRPLKLDDFIQAKAKLLHGGNHFLLHEGDLLLQSAGGLIHRGVDQRWKSLSVACVLVCVEMRMPQAVAKHMVAVNTNLTVLSGLIIDLSGFSKWHNGA
ncbi:hypothetical protein ACMD2_20469, partial [Ananas comosus]